MRTATWVVTMLLLAGAAVLADEIYMKDGKVHRGKAVRDGDKVRIETPLGVMVVNDADVLYIKEDVAASMPASQPEDEPAGGEQSAMPLATTGAITPPRITFNLNTVTRPESIVFMFMRNLEDASGGEDTFTLRKQIEQWQINAHDRKRRVPGGWYTPQDFINRRRSYAQALQDAATFAKESRVSGTPRTPEEKAQQAKVQEQLNKKLFEAAGRWPDPLLRQFLKGVAYYRAQNYHQASTFFRNCCREGPWVAGFYQGYGLCLLELKRETDALAAFVAALELQPQSLDALELVLTGMRKVPGAETRSPAYQRAEKLRALYDTSNLRKSSSTDIRWLMPGKKTWYDRDETLPTPPYDRLVFMQAVGVPVAPGALLVDEAVVKNALAVYVQVGQEDIVPGVVQRISSYSSSKKGPQPPLAMITVEEYDFTPAVSDKPVVLKPKDEAIVHGLGVFEEMGSDVRVIPSYVTEAGKDGQVTLWKHLSAGDSAGPVLRSDGQLLGFLAAKTNPAVRDGGPDQFIPLSDLADLIEKAAKLKHRSSSSSSSSRARRKDITPRRMEAKFVTVHAVLEETFE